MVRVLIQFSCVILAWTVSDVRADSRVESRNISQVLEAAKNAASKLEVILQAKGARVGERIATRRGSAVTSNQLFSEELLRTSFSPQSVLPSSEDSEFYRFSIARDRERLTEIRDQAFRLSPEHLENGFKTELTATSFLSQTLVNLTGNSDGDVFFNEVVPAQKALAALLDFLEQVSRAGKLLAPQETEYRRILFWARRTQVVVDVHALRIPIDGVRLITTYYRKEQRPIYLPGHEGKYTAHVTEPGYYFEHGGQLYFYAHFNDLLDASRMAKSALGKFEKISEFTCRASNDPTYKGFSLSAENVSAVLTHTTRIDEFIYYFRDGNRIATCDLMKARLSVQNIPLLARFSQGIAEETARYFAPLY
ncbi:hypothetical protein K2X30_12435 [bacterium]|nr:hypothetical protein [bacterium]